MSRTLSETHRANISAGGMGRIMTAETRAKIGDANRGQVRSLEVRQEMSRSRKGRRRHTVESKAKIAAVSVANAGRKCSSETRAKMSVAHKGQQVSARTRSLLSAKAKDRFANGRTNLPPNRMYTKLAQRLHRYLEDVCGIVGLLIEERFGSYQVDLFDPVTRTAFEADGHYWHDLREKRNPGYQMRRDAYLKDGYGITVVHFTDVEIKALTSKVAA